MRTANAASGFQALAMLHHAARNGDPFDVAILDMQMPMMDGLALASSIKSDPSIATTALLLLTSMGERLSEEEMGRAGIHACLEKPAKQSQIRH
jgi:CheY-like chemotaxis protein